MYYPLNSIRGREGLQTYSERSDREQRGESSTEREGRRRLVEENRVPATRTTPVRTLLLLGWNTASDLEAEGMHFRKGGHREEGASESALHQYIVIVTLDL